MNNKLFSVYRVVAWIVFIGIVLQFAAAGMLIFVGWRLPHLAIGTLLPLVSLILLILSFAARTSGRTKGLTGLLFALLVAQHLILGFGQGRPWVLVFHVVVPVMLPLISLALARQPRLAEQTVREVQPHLAEA
jgi:hypothetical protein